MQNFIILMFVFCGSQSVYAETIDNPRLASVSKLINVSSGAKQVLKSDSLEAKKLQQEAKELLSDAEQKYASGNEAEGALQLDQSVKLMFKAIRLATPVEVGDKKNRHDYDKREKSVAALRDAFNRITDEKNKPEVKIRVNNQVDKILEKSVQMEKTGQHASAKNELDKAYVLLKQSIETLRSGQTLVRSLNFATAEEEYHYELDRNDTHKMLVKLLLGEKQTSEYTQKAVAKFTLEAGSLRLKAEKAASDEDFKQAIDLLEQSTKQFVRAIRSAGVYIPG